MRLFGRWGVIPKYRVDFRLQRRAAAFCCERIVDTIVQSHYSEQLEIVAALAERVQTLGGVALALAHDVVEESRIARAPRGRESVTAQLNRLLYLSWRYSSLIAAR